MNFGDTKLPDRFWDKCCTQDESGCWLWTGARFKAGYAGIRWGGAAKYGHRVAYEVLVGEVPAGLELDHLCRTPACVNPDHLEPVSHRENLARADHSNQGRDHAEKTHCPSGHPYSGDNLYVSRKGRQCKTCIRKHKKAYRIRQRGPA